MLGKDAKATAALESMAKASGTDLAGFKGQLATTYLYCDAGQPPWPRPAARTWSRRWTWCASSPSITACWARARRRVDVVGIEFPGGKTLGNKANIKMRFDTSYMKMAADGKL